MRSLKSEPWSRVLSPKSRLPTTTEFFSKWTLNLNLSTAHVNPDLQSIQMFSKQWRGLVQSKSVTIYYLWYQTAPIKWADRLKKCLGGGG